MSRSRSMSLEAGKGVDASVGVGGVAMIDGGIEARRPDRFASMEEETPSVRAVEGATGAA
jgi:hypothetical protein